MQSFNNENFIEGNVLIYKHSYLLWWLVKVSFLSVEIMKYIRSSLLIISIDMI